MSAKDTTTLYTALLAALRAMGPVKKDASNPAFRTKYATLQSVLETIEEPLWANGLIVMQRFAIADDGAGMALMTEIIHAESGERTGSVVPIVSKDPTDPQKMGGAITYYRRYSLLALLGLAPEDDDGNAAAKPAPRPQERPRREPLNAAPLGSAYDEAEYERLSRQVRVNDEALSGAEYSRYNELDRLRKERPAPAPPAAPVANGSRPHPDDVIAILGEMDDAREPWHEIKKYADDQSDGRFGDDVLRIHDKLKAIAARRRNVKPPASVAG
jgi:hypothetical protein